MILRNARFIRAKNKGKVHIVTPGYSWGYGQGSRLNLACDGEKYQVWHKPYTQDWAGRGCAPAGFPAIYMLMEIDGDRAKTLEEFEQGHNWRSVLRALTDRCNLLNEETKLTQVAPADEGLAANG